MSWLAPLAALAGTVASGWMASDAQDDANQTNINLAREAMQWNKDSTKEAMRFSERMSSTAYQRQMDDLRSAGLNPILAATKGGATAPQGASATSAPAKVEANTQMAQALRGGVSSALDAVRIDKELEQADSQIALQETQKLAAAAQAVQSQATARNTDTDTKEKELDITQKGMRTPLLRQEIRTQKKQSEFDESASTYDNILRRVGDTLGTINKAINPIQNLKDGLTPNPKKKYQQKHDEWYKQRPKPYKGKR